MLRTNEIKKDFPIFNKHPHLVYLDSTATSLKPVSVTQKVREYYEEYSSNIHRGIYELSEKASQEYEETRKIVADFIHAADEREIIFTRSTTESINLIAYALGRNIVERNDEIVTTIAEHHSNFVPWQQLAAENGAVLKILDVDEAGNLSIEPKELEQVITRRTKILTLTYISNVLGTINPIKELIQTVKKINPHVITVVDAAQAVPHHSVNVKDLGCDFIAFSSHKMLGPTGVGVLYGKYELLERMSPFQYGGDMISEVYLDKTIFKDPPSKFEAGTPHIDGVIALKEAIRYLNQLGMGHVAQHESELLKYALDQAEYTFGSYFKRFKTGRDGCGIVTFQFGTIHPHDVAQILDEEGIAIRAGNHCAMPLHTRFNINASCRASFYLYNDKKDVDSLIKGLSKVKKLLG